MKIDPDLIVWSHQPDQLNGRPLLLMLHGYGSNERDLASLAPHLPKHLATAALRAPLQAHGGFAWVPIIVPGEPDPAMLEQATTAVLNWLDETIDSATPVGLLGFSQGGLMVTQLMRLRPHRFACGVVLSGFTSDVELPSDEELAERKPPVFFGRGTIDGTIVPSAFNRAAEWLPRHTDLTEVVYPGLAHSISLEELSDVSTFLNDHLPEKG